MTTPPTKRQFRATLQVETDAEVAAFFDISASAVSQWPEDDPIPRARWFEAQVKLPAKFGVVAEEGAGAA